MIKFLKKEFKKNMVFEADDGLIINADCLDIMKQLPDNCVELSLVDPPYGIDIASSGSLSIKGASSATRSWTPSEWDKNPPTKEYFDEMKRVSMNQIIWGGNYFVDHLPPSPCWLVWNKKKGLSAGTFADCELAWTSFKQPSRVFNSRWHGFIRDSKELRVDFPTQKALDLFAWCVREFSKKGDIIFDPFLGSGTTAIAARMLGRKFIGVEINKDHCDLAVKRLAKVQFHFGL